MVIHCLDKGNLVILNYKIKRYTLFWVFNKMLEWFEGIDRFRWTETSKSSGFSGENFLHNWEYENKIKG